MDKKQKPDSAETRQSDEHRESKPWEKAQSLEEWLRALKDAGQLPPGTKLTVKLPPLATPKEPDPEPSNREPNVPAPREIPGLNPDPIVVAIGRQLLRMSEAKDRGEPIQPYLDEIAWICGNTVQTKPQRLKGIH